MHKQPEQLRIAKDNATKKIIALLDKKLSLGATTLAISLTAWLFFSPVISQGVDYNDDTNRSIRISHGHDFIQSGRFVAEGLSTLLSGMSKYPIDYGSLGQILGVAVVVLTLLILLKSRFSYTPKHLLAIMPLLINPFLLQNISYRYDAFGMMLAYAAAITAFAIFKKTKIGFILPTILLFISLGIYQSMTTLFIMLSALGFLYSILTSKSSIVRHFSTLFLQAISYVAAMLLYLITTTFIFPATSGRNSLQVNLASIPDNMRATFDIVSAFIVGPIGVVSIAMIVMSLALLMIISLKHKSPISRTLLLVSVGLASPLIILGPMVIVENALIYPRSLITISLIGLLASLAVISAQKKYHASQIIILAAMIVYLLFTVFFAHSYGAFLKSQSSHREIILNSIYNHIQSENITGKIYLSGRSDNSRSSNRFISQYPILKKIWPTSIDNPTWSERVLKNHDDDVIADWKINYPEKELVACSSPDRLVVSAKSYGIYKLNVVNGENEYLIKIKPSPSDNLCH